MANGVVEENESVPEAGVAASAIAATFWKLSADFGCGSVSHGVNKLPAGTGGFSSIDEFCTSLCCAAEERALLSGEIVVAVVELLRPRCDFPVMAEIEAFRLKVGVLDPTSELNADADSLYEAVEEEIPPLVLGLVDVDVLLLLLLLPPQMLPPLNRPPPPVDVEAVDLCIFEQGVRVIS